MDITISKLTVFFEKPFWVAIYERQDDGRYEVCKITFGAEPKDYEVFDYILKNWHRLCFTWSIEAEQRIVRRVSPKRMQRDISKQIYNVGTGTKAQQALKLQHERLKLERKTNYREKRDAERERLFELRQQKRKEKHKGH